MGFSNVAGELAGVNMGPSFRRLSSFMRRLPAMFRAKNGIVCGKHGRLGRFSMRNGGLVMGSCRLPRLLGHVVCGFFHTSGTGHSCSCTLVLHGLNVKSPTPIKCCSANS